MWILNSYRDKSWVLRRRECEHAIDPRRDINSTSISALNYPWSWNFNVVRSTFIVQLLIGCFHRVKVKRTCRKNRHTFSVWYSVEIIKKVRKTVWNSIAPSRRGMGFSDLRPINSDYRLINERVTWQHFLCFMWKMKIIIIGEEYFYLT